MPPSPTNLKGLLTILTKEFAWDSYPEDSAPLSYCDFECKLLAGEYYYCVKTCREKWNMLHRAGYIRSMMGISESRQGYIDLEAVRRIVRRSDDAPAIKEAAQ